MKIDGIEGRVSDFIPYVRPEDAHKYPCKRIVGIKFYETDRDISRNEISIEVTWETESNEPATETRILASV